MSNFKILDLRIDNETTGEVLEFVIPRTEARAVGFNKNGVDVSLQEQIEFHSHTGMDGTPQISYANLKDKPSNVPSADKLSTPRKINGVNFDGTLDITAPDATKLPLTGGTMTGVLTLKGDPSSPLHAATKQYVDAVAQGAGQVIAGSNIAKTGNTISVADSPNFTGTPIASTATKGTSTQQIATTAFVMGALDDGDLG